MRDRKVRNRVTIKYNFSPTKLANVKKSGNPFYWVHFIRLLMDRTATQKCLLRVKA